MKTLVEILTESRPGEIQRLPKSGFSISIIDNAGDPVYWVDYGGSMGSQNFDTPEQLKSTIGSWATKRIKDLEKEIKEIKKVKKVMDKL